MSVQNPNEVKTVVSSESSGPKYKRILLKISGEALQKDDRSSNIDPDATARIADRIKRVVDQGVQVAIVVGGGNIFRGLSGEARGIDRSEGDYMGMLATVINGLALKSALKQVNVDSRVMSAFTVRKVAEPFILGRALKHLAKGRVVIFTAGTGNPFFSTDTAAALRASEIRADVLLKATKVDGVYTDDPMTCPDAERYSTLTYTEALAKSLKVMDGAAFALCMENKIPIVVFNFFETGSLDAVIAGETLGTLVTEEE
jgi:uridylate kinase